MLNPKTLNKKPQQGVTLFEMILVMLIITLMTVSAIRYVNRQRDEAVSDRLAQKLYEYGHAVREYAYDHQTDIKTDNIDLEYEGVAWLQPDAVGYNETDEPYLHEDFTFAEGLDPLYLGLSNGNPGTQTNTDDEIVYTSFSWNEEEDRPEVTIQMGGLYDASAGVSETGVANPPQAMSSITAEAAQLASNFYDPIKGFAAISYNIDVASPDFPDVPIIGTVAHITTESEIYLRVDGQNYMKDYLSFIDADIHGGVTEDQDNFGIRYIETIDFDENASTLTQINNLNQLHFVAPTTTPGTGKGGINNVLDINLGSVTLDAATDTLLPTDTRHYRAVCVGNSCNVSVTGYSRQGAITLGNGTRMNTLQTVICAAPTGDTNYLLPLRQSNTSINKGEYLSTCFLMRDAGNSKCKIGRSTGLNPLQYHIGRAGNASAGKCVFACLVWDTRALHGLMCRDQSTVGGGYANL